MNGLANAILTLLLSWLRIIVNRIWSLVNSETGSRFFAFLAEHWLTILLVLGAGGFAVDKIIYLIRWRPFSVRRKRREQRELMEAYYEDIPEEAPPAQPMYDPSLYARPVPEPAYRQEVYEPQPEPVWDEAPAAEMPQAAQTAVYNKPARNVYRPPLTDVEPVFDEQPHWEGSDALVAEPAAVQMPQVPIFDQYMQDVNAGFARPIPPQQLYTPVQQPAAPAAEPEASPVHPGLDADLLRRNIGLGAEEPLYDENAYVEQPVSVAFTPFTQQTAPEQPVKKNRNPFLNLMRLVGDDTARPSIRDLQNTVDVREAFREPVYPQPLYRNEDEPT